MSTLNPLLVLSDSNNFIEVSYLGKSGCFLHISSGIMVVPDTSISLFSSSSNYTGCISLVKWEIGCHETLCLNREQSKEYIKKAF